MKKKILKAQLGIDLNYGNVTSNSTIKSGNISNFNPQSYNITFDRMFPPPQSIGNQIKSAITKGVNVSPSSTQKFMSGVGGQALSAGVGMATNYLTSQLGNLGDSEAGQVAGQAVSTAVSTVSDTVKNNLTNGSSAFKDLGGNLKNAGLGLAINYGTSKLGELGNKWMGDTKMSRFVNTVGAQAAANGLSQLAGLGGGFGPGAIAGMVGAGLSAAFGPSKEYGGKYGNITKIADTAYDVVQTGASFFGPVGSLVSGGMALNKGLSNIFGSTDGMTVQDSILGSAWAGAPVKWLNMAGAKTTSTFGGQSWQNTEKTESFMGNSFGKLSDKFSKAREEAGKTYGTFSRGAYNRAQANIDFANQAWDKVLAMANQNEYQNIRSQDMSSINNQRYAQQIQGGWSPLQRGKYGMKILNNATDHNRGMRYLSAAAFIDNKQMILSNWN